ncbi:hypothetical protein [Streptococcus hyointestinalis]|nr:hypothetical protein [Streptococcus hyointestinalis]
MLLLINFIWNAIAIVFGLMVLGFLIFICAMLIAAAIQTFKDMK